MPSLPRYVLYTSIFAATTAGCSQGPGQGGAGGSQTAGEQPTSGAAMQGSGGSDGRSMAGEQATPSDAGASHGGRGGAGPAGGGVSGNGGAGAGGEVAVGGVSGMGGMGGTGGMGEGQSSPGCGNSSAPRGARNLTMMVNGTSRTYWLWVPDGYDSKKPLPLIFAWHGSGGDGDEVRRTYFYLEPAVGNGAIIIYPDGLPVSGGSSGWDLAAEGIDVKFFDALLASTSQDYCVDRKRVFSTGYSFGGMFSHTLACSRGNQLRGIAPTAGAFFGRNGSCPTPVAAWIAHATNDNLVNFSAAEDARDIWLGTNGCGPTTTPTSPSPCVAYECTGAKVHWCVHNEGHEWPSFAAKGIWAFFSSL